MLGLIGWPVIDRFPLFGGLAISPHGVFIAVGFLLGSWWLLREGTRRGIRYEDLNRMIFWALIGAVIGARLFYVIGHAGEFSSIGEAVSIWRGGITLLGGIAGAVLINIPLLRGRGYRFLQVMDPAAIALAFGLGVGRIGDLIIGDHLGRPTSWLLGFAYKGGQLAGFECVQETCSTALLQGEQALVVAQRGAVIYRGRDVLWAAGGVHQTALYDLLGVWLLFLLLYWLNQRPRREGVLFCVFLLWYGAERIVTDFLRVDKTIFGLTGSQWTSIGAVIAASALLVKWAADAKRKGPLAPGPSTFFVPPREPQRA